LRKRARERKIIDGKKEKVPVWEKKALRASPTGGASMVSYVK